MKRSRELTHLRQLCQLELSGAVIMPAVLRAVRDLVPAGSAAFFWTDAQGDIRNFYAERLLPPGLMRRYFEQHYEAAQAFRQGLIERVRGARWTVALDAERELPRSYVDEILKPLQARYILQLIVRDGGRPLGQLSLYRGPDAAAFNADDLESAAALQRYLAPLVLRVGAALDAPSAWRSSGEAGLVLCDAQGALLEASPRACALFAYAAGSALERGTLLDGLERAVAGLAQQLVAECSHRTDLAPPVERRVSNAWGLHHLRVYPLGGARYGIVIQRQEHLLVRLVDAMRELPLSAQQREVVLLLANGRSNNEIAQALGVSLNTASYHVKQLFAKLDAHDRNEALARVLDRHTAR